MQPSKKSTPETAETPTCNETFDYWTWYYNPGNSIRQWDEEHGVKLVRDAITGIPRFEADREILFKDDQTVSSYPEYFQNRTIDRFVLLLYTYGEKRETAKSALEKTIRYLENLKTIISEYGGGGLYYYSHERGTGKTYLSTILGNELSKRGWRVRWFSMVNLIQEIKAGFDKDSSTSSADVINLARHAQVLILDDIGVEKQSAWLNETVYSILDHRMRQCKPTIFTSNHLPEELSYDERIIDRITRMTELIKMPEENIRRKLNSKNSLGSFLEQKGN